MANEEDGISLLELVRIAAKAYEGISDAWDGFIDTNGYLREDAETGDMLVNFIITELGDTYDPESFRDDQIAEAFRVTHRAMDELSGVASEFADLLKEMGS